MEKIWERYGENTNLPTYQPTFSNRVVNHMKLANPESRRWHFKLLAASNGNGIHQLVVLPGHWGNNMSRFNRENVHD